MTSRKQPAWMQTTVSVARSIEQIRALMLKYGAEQWSFPESACGDIDVFFVLRGQQIKVSLRAMQMANRLYNLSPHWDKIRIRQQAQRIVARQAFYYLKAAFEIVETGVFSPLDVLLAHLVLPSGEMLRDHVLGIEPAARRLLTGGSDDDDRQ